MKKKIISIVLTLLICVSSIIIPVDFKVRASGDGQILYVDGQGEGGYTKIQDAINDSNDGYTVFVFDSTYHENIVVNVSINLTGEDSDITIIDGSGNGTTVTITADGVNISGFTIQNGSDGFDDAGIKIIGNCTNVSSNIIKDCDALGVYLEDTHNNTIYNNTFINITNTSTIFLYNSSSYNVISKNNITNCGCAIDLGNGSHHNNISDNSIVNNAYGIYLWVNTTGNNSIFRNSVVNTTFDGILIEEAVGNKIFENVFERNDIGISIRGINSTVKNSIYHNNLVNNTEHIVDECNQTWDNGYPSGGNYWDDYIWDDVFSGSGQNMSGSDGLGDIPYFIIDNDTAIDWYPMMLKWGDYLPVAIFTYSINGLTVSFNASGSYDRDGKIVSYSWNFGDTNNGTGVIVNHTYSQNGTYEIVLTVTDNENKNDTFSKHVFLGYDPIPPEIHAVSDSPDTVGFGFPVNLTANVTDDFSGVKTVKVNVTYPDNSSVNYTMNHMNGNIYQYDFTDTWQTEQYNYTVWTLDYANNSNSSSQCSFNVSVQANVSVYPIKDAFGDDEFINITDPPSLEGNEDGFSQPPTKSMDEKDNDPMPLDGESSGTAEENVTYYFNDYDTNEAWAINPSLMVDGDIRNSSSTTIDGDVELCNNNTCSGTNLGSISKVEIRVYGFCPMGSRDIILRPVLYGRDGNNYPFDATPMPAWSEWFDITADPCRPDYQVAKWTWSEVRDLDCDVEAEDNFGPMFVLECSKVEIRVTYTNTPPVASDPAPIDGAIGITLPPTVSITVYDADGQPMDITWYHSSENGTNSSIGCSWIVFGTNTSVGNGVYRQVFSNATENYTWYYWKVNVTDGKRNFESSVFKFYSGVCQSKINNTGSTDISGYLLIEVHFYNTSSSEWIVDHHTVDETVPRIVNSSKQLGLDTIFNGLVNTWDLSHNSGTYRVYVAFRDPDGNVLQNDDSTFMESSFNFSVYLDMESDDDGWTDYEENNFYYTDPQKSDTDGDGVPDDDDVDPLVDLKVNLTTKRIYASEYTYTWREGESWNWSTTNASGAGDGTKWINLSNSSASNGTYTRQNDSMDGINDNATWNFTVKKAGVYYIWMRSHRYKNASSNISLFWNNKTVFKENKKTNSFEPHWYQDSTDEWKWTCYGLVDMSVGAGTLKIENLKESGTFTKFDFDIAGKPYFWMEVDNILITDDPHCHPNGKGVEGLNDYTIGSDLNSSWDPGQFGSDPDFYVKTIIANITNTSEVFENDSNVLEDWSAVVDVPDDEENVSITIELWEYDGPGDVPVDLHCDISSTDKNCSIIYNLRNGTWWGDDHVLDIDFIGRTCGEVDGDYSPSLDANVIFEVSQNDYDNDGITYWQEVNIYKNEDPFHPNVTNDRYAVIVGGGANCKVRQTKDIGSTSSPYKGTYLLYESGYNWTNYTFEVDLMTKEFCDPDDKEDIGVMFRYQDDNNYYILRWEEFGMRDRMFLWKVVNGEYSNLAKRVKTPLTRTVWYTLSITLDGNNIKVKKDDNEIFDVTDDTFSDGRIALFCWKNKAAWFDDVLVVDGDNGDVLLQDGFDDYERSEWTEKDPGGPSSNWELTDYYVQAENYPLTLNFVYRILRIVAHYDKDKIRYLSNAKWRDADGDSGNDVALLSVESNVKESINTWLKDNSDGDDSNLIYMFDNGDYRDKSSWLGVDTNRDGDIDSGDRIYSYEINSSLPDYGKGGINRLTFLVEACHCGYFILDLSQKGQNRTIITATEHNRCIGAETGQDWPAFTRRFLKEMSIGNTSVAEAFNIADKHIEKTNFKSIFQKQDPKLDDNGNGKGSDYDLPSDGDWHDVYEGSYTNYEWITKKIEKIEEDYDVKKARVRFHVRRGLWPKVTADLHEFDFFNGTEWVSPDGHSDPDNAWDNETYAYDDDENTKAGCTIEAEEWFWYWFLTFNQWIWTPYIELTLTEPLEPLKCNKIQFYAWYNGLHCNKIDVDVYYLGNLEGVLAAKTGL